MSSNGSFFPIPSVAELPPGLQSLCGKAEAELGFVPNVFLGYAHRPQRL